VSVSWSRLPPRQDPFQLVGDLDPSESVSGPGRGRDRQQHQPPLQLPLGVAKHPHRRIGDEALSRDGARWRHDRLPQHGAVFGEERLETFDLVGGSRRQFGRYRIQAGAQPDGTGRRDSRPRNPLVDVGLGALSSKLDAASKQSVDVALETFTDSRVSVSAGEGIAFG
jgi:hypothetical protein